MKTKISRAALLKGAGIGMVAALLPLSIKAQSGTTGLHYQGRLTSPDGTPVADGAYDVVFALFAGPTGGAALWTESATVSTRAGAFAVMLGRNTPFPPGLFTNPLWLEIAVSNRTLVPRQELGASPYAMTAMSVPAGSITGAMVAQQTITGDRLVDHTVTEKQLAPGVSVPVGSVISWWGDSANVPGGWKLCDGTAVNDANSELNGKTVPDLRNKFVRGASGDVRTSTPTGGADTINLAHSHTVNAHNHMMFRTGANAGDWFAPNGQQITTGSQDTNSGPIKDLSMDGASPTPNTTYNTGDSSPGTNSTLSATQSILPSYIGLVYIMRI